MYFYLNNATLSLSVANDKQKRLSVSRSQITLVTDILGSLASILCSGQTFWDRWRWVIEHGFYRLTSVWLTTVWWRNTHALTSIVYPSYVIPSCLNELYFASSGFVVRHAQCILNSFCIHVLGNIFARLSHFIFSLMHITFYNIVVKTVKRWNE